MTDPTPPSGTPSSDFLERPAFVLPAAESLMTSGTVLAERFEIRRHLGRGGMGDVYEAHDRELDVVVAVKTIRPEFARHDVAVDILRREVTRARRIAHANVARVFDLFTHTDPRGVVTRFLTMELITGPTLAARLQQGPLAPAEAWPIVRDIAAALDEAHRLDIVHRDLKPGNVMLVERQGDGRAVVTDFGLALDLAAVAGKASLASEVRGGTIGYAAPEQLTGATVGPPVDIYAFGTLIHEVLTGQLPDSGGRTGLPRRWARAIADCRRDDPSARPPSASAVIASLGPLRAPVLPTLLVVLLATVSLLAMALRLPDQQVSSAAHPEIVIADVANLTADPTMAGVTQLLRRQVEQSTYLSVVPPDEVRQRLRVPAAAPAALTGDMGLEAVRVKGTGYAASGRLRRSGNAFVLTLRVQSVTVGGRGDRNWVRSYEARDSVELQSAVQRGAAWIRTTIGESADSVTQTDRPVADVTTDSWLALDLYSRADTLLADGKQDDALALLNEAVRVDPDFASAWMRMGDVLMSRRQYDEAYRRWSEALRLVERKDLGTREAYRIRGMFASDTHDYVDAERVYRLYLLRYPDDFAPYFYIARPLMMLGRTGDAIAMLERAQLKDPSSFATVAQLAMFNLRAGRLDEVRMRVRALRRMGQVDWAACIEGQLYFVEGRYGEALQAFGAMADADDAWLRRRSKTLRAAVLAELGQTGAALRLLEETGRFAEDRDSDHQADRMLSIASLRLRAGDRQACRDACLLSLRADQSPQRLAQAASLLARAGFVADAERLASRLDPHSPSRQVRLDRERVEGEILLARRSTQAAWRHFEAAAALEPPGGHAEYLARAAAAVGESGTALKLYEAMASDPYYFWRYPDEAEPGRWRAAVEEYIRLVRIVPGASPRSDIDQYLRSLSASITPKETDK